jgi:hypothetical protein
VETPGRWKAWKTKSRFSTLPTAPWKSRKPGEIPTFPQLRRSAHGKVENQNQVSHFSTRASRIRLRSCFSQNQRRKKKGGFRVAALVKTVSDFQAHRPLETDVDFRLILCWK